MTLEVSVQIEGKGRTFKLPTGNTLDKLEISIQDRSERVSFVGGDGSPFMLPHNPSFHVDIPYSFCILNAEEYGLDGAFMLEIVRRYAEQGEGTWTKTLQDKNRVETLISLGFINKVASWWDADAARNILDRLVEAGAIETSWIDNDSGEPLCWVTLTPAYWKKWNEYYA